MTRKLMIIAGEISGDQHAARLVRDLRAARPDVELFGIGGEAMRREGVRTLLDVGDMAVVGFAEVLSRLPFFLRVFRQMQRLFDTEKPDALLLVDYPGFNLRLAAKARAKDIPVYYYISPQVWAWNRSRIPKMAKIIDLLMVIFPFEVDVFKDTPLRTAFVGHPLVGSNQRTLAKPTPPMPWPDGTPRIALVPGSRRVEIQRILPRMLDTARELRRRHPNATFLIPAASGSIRARIEARLAALPEPERAAIAVVNGQLREVIRQARAAIVCSGTATMETALLQCPMIITHRIAPFTYWFGRKIIRIPWLGMVNIIAGKTICPEFIQNDAQPVPMADAIDALLGDTPARQAQLDALAQVSAALHGGDHIPTAGQLVADTLP